VTGGEGRKRNKWTKTKRQSLKLLYKQYMLIKMSDDNFFKIYFNQVRKKRARIFSFLLEWIGLL